MEISVRLKHRFCKDCNIPLRLFQEPYFSERLHLYDQFYGTLQKWELFVNELQHYKCEQDYFEAYNHVKDAAITDIKMSEGYRRFCECDMNLFRMRNTGFPAKDIYRTGNDGNMYISIDMRKANFSALHHYDPDIFGGAESWEMFISKYTSNMHIVNSKYIREVIFGKCNPGRHITYEKYLMDEFLTDCLAERKLFAADRIKLFSNDEIVIDVTDLNTEACDDLFTRIQALIRSSTILFRAEKFILHKVSGTNGYYKEIIRNGEKPEIVFKCLDNYMLPFVIRSILGQEIEENDKVFYHEGLLAKFIEIPSE